MNTSSEKLDALVKGLTELPPTPQILPKLQQLLQDEDVTLLDIASLIKIDASLTAQIIRLSNSGYFGTSTPCASLEEAINRVGFNEVYQLVSILSFKKILDTGIEVYGLKPGELWEAAISTAVAFESFASLVNEDLNTAYTIGMVHSIGKVVINHILIQKKRGVDTSSIAQQLTPEEEENTLGFNYAQAGGALLRSWAFPEIVWQTLEDQLSPMEPAHENTRTLACLLNLSKHGGKQLVGLKGKTEPFDSKIIEALNLDIEAPTKVMQMATKRFQDIQNLLRAF
tara:strand:- start:56391 stop:57242 length:852 start_codon:yes stop_codon:yes gene_type:complete